MMAIKISTKTTADTLISKSHWWGFPDLPDGMDFPTMSSNAGERCDENEGEDLLTFICQIKLEDIAPFDSANLLPHQGMLYFFASLNYFLGDLEAFVECIGFWPESSYKVIYVPAADGLHTHKVVWLDGTDACLPAESMCFEKTGEYDDNHKLLGMPFFEEVRDEAPNYLSLLQIDEDERWGLRFYDCGMLNFLISKEDLAAKRFDKVKLYFHSL